MHFLLYSTILSIIISNSLADKSIKTCRCLAHLNIEDPMSLANRLNTMDITDQIPKYINCDNRGEFMCKALCKQIYKEMTNNFDLDKPPINVKTTVPMVLGQYLCDVLHRDICNTLLGMTSELSCIDSGSGGGGVKITTSTLNIYCDKRLTCLNGKYVKQSL